MSNEPLDWIKLELIPLPGTTEREAMLLWWNPEQRILEGEGFEQVLDLIHAATERGSLQTGAGGHIEISDPLHQPTELAAVLAQFYWVVPQPVERSGQIEVEQAKSHAHLN